MHLKSGHRLRVLNYEQATISTQKAMAQNQICKLSTLRNQGAFVIPKIRKDNLYVRNNYNQIQG